MKWRCLWTSPVIKMAGKANYAYIWTSSWKTHCKTIALHADNLHEISTIYRSISWSLESTESVQLCIGSIYCVLWWKIFKIFSHIIISLHTCIWNENCAATMKNGVSILLGYKIQHQCNRNLYILYATFLFFVFFHIQRVFHIIPVWSHARRQ